MYKVVVFIYTSEFWCQQQQLNTFLIQREGKLLALGLDLKGNMKRKMVKHLYYYFEHTLTKNGRNLNQRGQCSKAMN